MKTKNKLREVPSEESQTSYPPSQEQLEKLDVMLNVLVQQYKEKGKSNRWIRRMIKRKFNIEIIEEDEHSTKDKSGIPDGQIQENAGGDQRASD